MTYATRDDLIKWSSTAELIQLTDLSDPPTGEIDDDLVTVALADADAEINSYISTGIATPVTPVPRILVQRACAIARFRLARDHASDRIQKDYDDAIAWCVLVSKGVVKLGDDVAPAQDTPAEKPKLSSAPRVFTRDSLRGL
ncbi:MAG: DUF1320 domain-containing protein [Rhizomicrobium sp.]